MHYFADKIYPVTKIWAGPIAAVMIRHPDDLEVLRYKRNILLCAIIY